VKTFQKLLALSLLIIIALNALAIANIAAHSASQNQSKPNTDENSADTEALGHREPEKTNASLERRLSLGPNRWGLKTKSDWEKSTRIQGNMAEIVIGMNAHESSYSRVKSIVANFAGKIKDEISIASNVKAFVAIVPFELASLVADSLIAAKACRYVEPNWKIETDFTPNDPNWEQQWGPKKIQADYAWNTTVGSHSVLIAIIDTGIDYTHPDLAANYVPLGYDWVNDDDEPMDDHGHGTHCAGIAAGVTNNAEGIAGIAQVGIMTEKCLNENGQGYAEDLAKGIIHAVDQGADILSNSWGSDAPSSLIEDAIEYASSNGVLVCASAGNSGTDALHYPSSYDDVVAVTATDSNDSPAFFTSFGDWVEVAAPGVSILSAIPGGYGSKSGTSMSCPHVAGVAALILSLHSNLSNVQLRQALRYASDDLGEKGFDEYYGYGRINARKGVEELPLGCDLTLWNWTKPPYVEPNDLGEFSATVYNYGTAPVNNVVVQLTANETLIDQYTIANMTSDTFATATLDWTPQIQGTYNITVFVVPSEGETNTRFNAASAYVDVAFAKKIVVVDSGGTAYSYTITEVWNRLNREWRHFGDQMIYIDYVSLAKYSISYEDIVASDADVLLISSADFREYTDEEIDAISRYSYNGHGLMATFLLDNPSNSPNNRKLMPLFGLASSTNLTVSYMPGILSVLDPTHPLFAHVPTSLNLTDFMGAAPSDRQWDMSELQGGTYLALESSGNSSIASYRGSVYISPNLERTAEAGAVPLPEDTHMQLLYNAMTWAQFIRPEHELITTVESPGFVMPNEQTRINLTVTNIGSTDEFNVMLQLFINSSNVYSYQIPSIAHNSSYTLAYPWRPSQVGDYNVTAYVVPVSGEDNAWNNEAATWIKVAVPPDILIVADNDEYENVEYNERTSLPEFKTALDALGKEYYVWEEKLKGPPSVDFMKQFKLIFWTCGEAADWTQITISDCSKIISYVKQGGKIMLDGSWISQTHAGYVDFTRYVTHASYYGMTWPWLNGTDGITVTAKGNLVAWGLPEEMRWEPDRNNAHGRELPLIATAVQPAYGGIGIFGYLDNPEPLQLEGHYPLPFVIGWQAAAISEDNGEGTTIYFPFAFFALPASVRNRIIKNSLNWLFPEQHELTVTLSTIKENVTEAHRPVCVNVTVGNWGVSSEANVEAEVRINGVLVDSHVVASIASRSSYTCSYLWTPESTGAYIIAANVFPVEGESIVDDNVISRVVTVRRLVVALVSDQKQLEPLELILASMGIGSHAYSFNKYLGYAKSLSTLSSYRVVVFDKTARKLTLQEYNAFRAYLENSGNLLATGEALVYETGKIDTYMTDIVNAVCHGIKVIRDRTIYVTDDVHPVMDGPYGTFPVGYTTLVPEAFCENATANLTRQAVTVAKWISASFSADKIIATSLNPGRVAYWNGYGHVDWIESADCQAMFKNMITWLELGEFHDLEVSITLPELVEPNQSVTVKAETHNVGYHDESGIEFHLLINGSEVLLIPLPALAKRSVYTLEYEWTPSAVGTYNLTAYASSVSQEINETNNAYSVLVEVRRWPVVSLAVPLDLQVDQVFTVNVTVSEVINLTEWELELFYRNYVLNGTFVAEGSFLNSFGGTVFQVSYFNDAYNTTHGRVRLSCSLANQSQGASGSGIFAALVFRARATGTCNLILQSTRLTTTTSPVHPHHRISASMTVGLFADLNNDGVVDIMDVVIVSGVYGKKLGEEGWNPQADVAPDDLINILDVVKITANYGDRKTP